MNLFDRSFKQVSDFAAAANLIPKDSKILIALSGGPDSVFLTECLLRLRSSRRLSLRAFHLDHGIRTDSSADGRWVRNFCKKKEIEFTLKRVSVPRQSQKLKLSLEETGREVRYRELAAAAARYRLTHIATGHSRSDLAETVLMRLIRGTGLAGLDAIPSSSARGARALIRPLLCLSASQIRQALESAGIASLKDPSNQNETFLRNRLRHDILPRLTAVNPAAEAHLAQLASDAAGCMEALGVPIRRFLRSPACRKSGRGYRLSVSALRAQPDFVRRQILLRILGLLAKTRIGYRRSHITEISRWITHPPKDTSKAALRFPHRVRASLRPGGTIRIEKY